MTKFLIVWTNDGLKHIFNLTQWETQVSLWEKDNLFNMLTDVDVIKPPELPRLQSFLIKYRLRCNIYLMETALSEDEITYRFQFGRPDIERLVYASGIKVHSINN